MTNMDDHYIRLSEHKLLLNREYICGLCHGFITGAVLVVIILVGLYV
jgi:hypothetical protein